MAAAPQRGANPSFATEELGEVVCSNNRRQQRAPNVVCVLTILRRFHRIFRKPLCLCAGIPWTQTSTICRADTGVCPYGWLHPHNYCISGRNYSNYDNFFPINISFSLLAFESKNENFLFFILYSPHLFVSLASPKIGCVSTKKEKNEFFLCFVLDFHYLCRVIQEL